MNKKKIKEVYRHIRRKYKEDIPTLPSAIKKKAWDITQGYLTYLRKILYGKLLREFSTKEMRKNFALRRQAQFTKNIVEALDRIREEV